MLLFKVENILLAFNQKAIKEGSKNLMLGLIDDHSQHFIYTVLYLQHNFINKDNLCFLLMSGGDQLSHHEGDEV